MIENGAGTGWTLDKNKELLYGDIKAKKTLFDAWTSSSVQ